MSSLAINDTCPEFQGEPKFCQYFRITKIGFAPDNRVTVVPLTFLNKNLPKVCGPCNNPKPSADLPSNSLYLSLLNSIDDYIDNYTPTPGQLYPNIYKVFADNANNILKQIVLDYFEYANTDSVVITWPKKPGFDYFYVNDKVYRLGYIRGTWGAGSDPINWENSETTCYYTSIFDLGHDGGDDGYMEWDGRNGTMMTPDCDVRPRGLKDNPEICEYITTPNNSIIARCKQCKGHFANTSECICKDIDGNVEAIARRTLGKDNEILCGSIEDDFDSVGETRKEFCQGFNNTTCSCISAHWPWWQKGLDGKAIPQYRIDHEDNKIQWIPSEYRATRSAELFKLNTNPGSIGRKDPNGNIFFDTKLLPQINNKNIYIEAYEKWAQEHWDLMDDDWKEAVFAVYGIVEPESDFSKDLMPYIPGNDPNGEPRQVWLELWGLDLDTKKMVKKVNPLDMEDQSNIIRNYIFVEETVPSQERNIADLYIGFNMFTCELEEHILYPGDPEPCNGKFIPPPDMIIPTVCPLTHVKRIKHWDGQLLSEKDPREFAKLEIEYQNKFSQCQKACCVNIKAKTNWKWSTAKFNDPDRSPIIKDEERQFCLLTGKTACDTNYITEKLIEQSYYRFNYNDGSIYKDCTPFYDWNIPLNCAPNDPCISDSKFWDSPSRSPCLYSDNNKEFQSIPSPFEILSINWNEDVENCEGYSCPIPPVTENLGTCCYPDSVSSWGCAVNTKTQCVELKGFWEGAIGDNPANCSNRGATLVKLTDNSTILATLGPRDCNVHGTPDDPDRPLVFDGGLLPKTDDTGNAWQPPVWTPTGSNPFTNGSLSGTNDKIYLCVGGTADCTNNQPGTNSNIWQEVTISTQDTIGTCCYSKLVNEVEADKLARSQVRSSNKIFRISSAAGQTFNADIKLTLLNDGSIILLTFPDINSLNTIYPPNGIDGVSRETLIENNFSITSSTNNNNWKVEVLKIENNIVTLTTVPITT